MIFARVLLTKRSIVRENYVVQWLLKGRIKFVAPR